MRYEAILFDLDGTLIDSASDLIYTLNVLLAEYGRSPVELDAMSTHISEGHQNLIAIGFNHDYPIEFELLRQKFIALYAKNNTRHTAFLAGIEAVLETIEAARTPWGIITNKYTEATTPIIKHLQLDKRASTIVCGDTLAVCKPDPAPLLFACKMLNVKPEHCVYIGDAITDIQAGNKAGMATIGCGYGYLQANVPIHSWEADAIVQTPNELLALIN